MTRQTVSANYVYSKVVEFFEIRAGSSKQFDAVGFNTASSPSLLQISCMGNPEKTMQGELVAFLRSQDLFVLSEAGFREFGISPDRNIDVLVMSGASPIVAIELKHYSPHQGGIQPLCIGLNADFKKSEKVIERGVGLIQVALYTQIERITPEHDGKSEDFGFYRFIPSYVKTKFVDSIETNQADFLTWLSGLPRTFTISTDKLVLGRPQWFNLPSSPTPYKVEGRISYFVGYVEAGDF